MYISVFTCVFNKSFELAISYMILHKQHKNIILVQQKNVVKDKSSQFLLPKGQGRIKGINN